MTLRIQPTERSFVPYNTTKSGGAIGAGLENLNAIYLSRKDEHPFKEVSLGSGVHLVYMEDNPVVSFLLRDGDEPIGFLNAFARTKKVIGTFVKPKYQGLGYGKKMYEAAIEHLGVLYSDDALSKFSSALWQSLSKRHTVKMVFNDQELPIVGWALGKGSMTYPVLRGSDVGLAHKEVSLEELLATPKMPKQTPQSTRADIERMTDDYLAKSKLKAVAQASHLVAYKT